jgi:S-adenosylmethionine uptake transporter
MTLNYTSPLFLAAFTVAAALRSNRIVERQLLAAIGIGFIGVILVLQPSFSHEQGAAAIAGLASGVFAAAAYWNVRELGRCGEPEWRTVFYFSLAGTVLGIAASIGTGLTPHDLHGALLLLAIGSTAMLARA